MKLDLRDVVLGAAYGVATVGASVGALVATASDA